MNTWRRITGARRDASGGNSIRGPQGQAAAAAAALADCDEPEEEIDLVALKSTPDVFMTENCDVMSFELNSLSARYGLEEIDKVQVQQLVHHVSANTDNLTAGIATCRSIGNLLHTASSSNDASRQHLRSAVRDADASLRISSLHKRSCALADMLAVCTSVSEAARLTAVAEALLISAQVANSVADKRSQAERAHATLLALDSLASHLQASRMARLRLQGPMLERCTAMQRDLRGVVSELLQRLCSAFDADFFSQVLALHVVDTREGADLPAAVRATFASLVTANDQFVDGQGSISLLQKLVVQDVLGTYDKGDMSLTALFREVPRVKLRGAMEHVMQRQFEWLQSYHAMQECVEEFLADAKIARRALKAGKAAVEWRGGVPAAVPGEEFQAAHAEIAAVGAVEAAVEGLAGGQDALLAAGGGASRELSGSIGNVMALSAELSGSLRGIASQALSAEPPQRVSGGTPRLADDTDRRPDAQQVSVPGARGESEVDGPLEGDGKLAKQQLRDLPCALQDSNRDKDEHSNGQAYILVQPSTDQLDGGLGVSEGGKSRSRTTMATAAIPSEADTALSPTVSHGPIVTHSSGVEQSDVVLASAAANAEFHSRSIEREPEADCPAHTIAAPALAREGSAAGAAAEPSKVAPGGSEATCITADTPVTNASCTTSRTADDGSVVSDAHGTRVQRDTAYSRRTSDEESAFASLQGSVRPSTSAQQHQQLAERSHSAVEAIVTQLLASVEAHMDTSLHSAYAKQPGTSLEHMTSASEFDDVNQALEVKAGPEERDQLDDTNGPAVAPIDTSIAQPQAAVNLGRGDSSAESAPVSAAEQRSSTNLKGTEALADWQSGPERVFQVAGAIEVPASHLSSKQRSDNCSVALQRRDAACPSASTSTSELLEGDKRAANNAVGTANVNQELKHEAGACNGAFDPLAISGEVAVEVSVAEGSGISAAMPASPVALSERREMLENTDTEGARALTASESERREATDTSETTLASTQAVPAASATAIDSRETGAAVCEPFEHLGSTARTHGAQRSAQASLVDDGMPTLTDVLAASGPNGSKASVTARQNLGGAEGTADSDSEALRAPERAVSTSDTDNVQFDPLAEMPDCAAARVRGAASSRGTNEGTSNNSGSGSCGSSSSSGSGTESSRGSDSGSSTSGSATSSASTSGYSTSVDSSPAEVSAVVQRSQEQEQLATLRGLSVAEFLKQRERILYGLSRTLARFRTEFGRQAARNMVKLYEARTSVQSEDFRVILDRGLDFAAMVAAFCAESPDRDRDEGTGERLPDDYLVDVVKSCCGQRLFEGYAREQRATLMADLLPMEQCERIRLKGVHTIAEAVEAATNALAAERQRDSAPFQYWVASRTFKAHPRKSALGSDLGSRDGSLQGALRSTPAGSGRSVDGPGRAGTESVAITDADAATLSDTSAPTQATGEGGMAEPEAAADMRTVTGSKPVYLLSTRHIVRVWAAYGNLLPVFKGTADVPLLIVRATQSLFEEFMLWIVTAFASIHPDAVVRGLGGTHDRFFQVVKRLMMSSDRSSGSNRFTRLLQHAQRELERADARKAGSTSVAAAPPERPQERGVVGGSLDRLVRGTIACDALATLASHLLQLEPALPPRPQYVSVQWERYYSAGDDAFLRVMAELFERGSGRLFRTPGRAAQERVVGSVHEVESVRERCVEGAAISNLDALRARVVAEIRRTSYAGVGLAAGQPAWLQALLSELQVFVDALLCCTQTRKLTKASLLEIWTVAVLHIDHVVLEALSEAVAPAGKFNRLMSSMVNAAKSSDRREAKRGLSRDGCMQLASDVAQLVRGIAQAQPGELGSSEAFRLMSVQKWVEGCHHPFAAQLRPPEQHRRMVDTWMLWAATCQRGTREGKAQCLALFTAMQRLHDVPDSTAWVRTLKEEVLA